MSVSISTTYKKLLVQKRKLENELAALPLGYISQKTINGISRFYLQHREGKKVVSKYIKTEDVKRVSKQIEKRKKVDERLLEINEQLTKTEQAAAILSKDLSCELALYNLSVGMDEKTAVRKMQCSSFASAMNAVEGVPVSSKTAEDVERWKDGQVSFLSVFQNTLKRYGFPVEG